ncbi:ykt6 [Nucleospora cyclopteri]
MPIIAVLSVHNLTNKIIKEAFCLEEYGFFARLGIQNILRALSRDLSEKIKDKQSYGENGTNGFTEIHEKIKEKSVVIVTKKDSKKRVILITDKDYNANVRFKALMAAMDPKCSYDDLIKEYKDWKKKDITSQIEKEMKIAHQNVVNGLSSVLDRGQTLNDLVMKSEHLSSQTKKLFEQAKKQNSCCGF